TDVTFHLFAQGMAAEPERDASREAAQDAADDGGADTGPEPCRKLGPEVCNGGDDDCNGVIDEECSFTVDWAPQPDGPFLGHTGGGVAFFENCPDGSVLTGVRVGLGQWLNQVSAVCSQIELKTATADGGVSFSLALGPRFSKPFAPAVSQDPTNQLYDMF